MAEDELTLKLTLVKTKLKLAYIFFFLTFCCFNTTVLQNVLFIIKVDHVLLFSQTQGGIR